VGQNEIDSLIALRKITNLKSSITDNKFREENSLLYLLFVIGDLRFVIFRKHEDDLVWAAKVLVTWEASELNRW
jgi:hypothetical protein